MEQVLPLGAAVVVVGPFAQVTLDVAVALSFLDDSDSGATQYLDVALPVSVVTLAVIVVTAPVFSAPQVDELFLVLQEIFSLWNSQGMYEQRRVFIL